MAHIQTAAGLWKPGDYNGDFVSPGKMFVDNIDKLTEYILSFTKMKAIMDVMAINPMEYGAPADGNSHPLGQKYATLALAQVDYPFATSLDQEQDWAVLQKIYSTPTNRGRSILILGDYMINSSITVSVPHITTYGPGTLVLPDNYIYEADDLRMFSVSAVGVDFLDTNFDCQNTGGTNDNVYLWLTAGSGLSNIQRCNFSNLPLHGSNFNGAVAILAGSSGRNIAIGNTFTDCPGALFTQSVDDIFALNSTKNPTDASYVVNGPNCKNVIIAMNNASTINTRAQANHIAAEQGANGFVIIGNALRGTVTGASIGLISVDGDTNICTSGIVAHNNVDCLDYNCNAALAIDKNYHNIDVYGNTFKNVGAGSEHAVMVLRTGGNKTIRNNTIITGACNRAITIIPGTDSGRMKINNNNIEGPASGTGSGIIMGSGSIPNAIIEVRNNNFVNFSEGIQTVNLGGTNGSNIKDFIMENNTYSEVTAPTNTPNIHGTWVRDQINLFAHKYPHLVSKDITSMFGTTMPSDGYFTPKSIINIANPTLVQGHQMGYIVNGYRRITTGTTHVLGQDWVEMRLQTKTLVKPSLRFRLTRAVGGGVTMRLNTNDNACFPHGLSTDESAAFTTSLATPPDYDWAVVGAGSSQIRYAMTGTAYILIDLPFDIAYMTHTSLIHTNLDMGFTVHTRDQPTDATGFMVISFKKLNGDDISLTGLAEDKFIEFVVGFTSDGF